MELGEVGKENGWQDENDLDSDGNDGPGLGAGGGAVGAITDFPRGDAAEFAADTPLKGQIRVGRRKPPADLGGLVGEFLDRAFPPE
jgi:hypothetical protein